MLQKNITVDGIMYYVQVFTVAGQVEVYADNNIVASCHLDGNMEQASYEYYDEEGEAMQGDSSGPVFFEHDGKTEEELAVDVGTWLAATHPSLY